MVLKPELIGCVEHYIRYWLFHSVPCRSYAWVRKQRASLSQPFFRSGWHGSTSELAPPQSAGSSAQSKTNGCANNYNVNGSENF